ncbi:hypothetical protein H2203_003662 [Taxawa tesnikishii (nom. ined.)]|nr:hypothetical protein H2203_003662 [Dothideales sp. JES 119]
MPKAEVGSTKWLSNNMKNKGLQRLRWYCQVCQRQMRDENGFKQHTLSEGHVRAMLIVGEDPRKFINDYSNQFKRDFLQLLKTAHGEKKVHINHFYQEYISDKQHIHMNATKWPSLTEFAKYLGREGICRVEEGERGLEIAWIDDSPEALRRRENVLKKEKMEKGEEEREARLLEAQIKRAREQKAEREAEEKREEDHSLKKPAEGLTIGFSLGAKPKPKDQALESTAVALTEKTNAAAADFKDDSAEDKIVESAKAADALKPAFSFGMGNRSAAKSDNVFSSKNNPMKQKASYVAPPPKKMSEAERIMREEMERKRIRDERNAGSSKRPRLG